MNYQFLNDAYRYWQIKSLSCDRAYFALTTGQVLFIKNASYRINSIKKVFTN